MSENIERYNDVAIFEVFEHTLAKTNKQINE